MTERAPASPPLPPPPTPSVVPLRSALKAAVPPDCYHSDSQVVGVEARAGGVAVTLEGGARQEGRLLVGADGPGSVVRRTLSPDLRSEYQASAAPRRVFGGFRV